MKFAMILILVLAVVLATPHLNYAKIVGVWLFDEAGGKVVNDASGNGHEGQIVGAVKWGKGKFGAALAFDGGNVTIPHHDSMNLIQFTITAWIKVPKIVNPSKYADVVLIKD